MKTLSILARNPLSLIGLVLVAIVVLSALLADFITPFPARVGAVVDFTNFNKPPHWPNLFGTDLVGRDLTIPLVEKGEPVGDLSLAAARERVKAGLHSLPWDGLKLSRGDAAKVVVDHRDQVV